MFNAVELWRTVVASKIRERYSLMLRPPEETTRHPQHGGFPLRLVLGFLALFCASPSAARHLHSTEGRLRCNSQRPERSSKMQTVIDSENTQQPGSGRRQWKGRVLQVQSEEE